MKKKTKFFTPKRTSSLLRITLVSTIVLLFALERLTYLVKHGYYIDYRDSSYVCKEVPGPK